VTDAVLTTAADLAQRLGASLLGAPAVRIGGVDTLERAGADTLSFIRDERNLAAWRNSRCAAAFISADVAASIPADEPALRERALIVVKDADLAMVSVLELLAPRPHHPSGISPDATIDPSATLGPDVAIGPGVIIGPRAAIGARTIIHANSVISAEARVGAGCVLFAGVVILDRCSIGDQCILHPGVVIGADGFGYRPAPDGRGLIKIPHMGTVEVGPHVEIGANACIDRGKFGATSIGAGTKIDNLVQIGHNCQIGRSCIICGQAALAGSVILEDGVTLGGSVGIADHIRIGTRAVVGGRSGVMDDIPPGETWFGYPARPVRQALRTVSAMDKLADWMPILRRKIKKEKDL
jgi:UDP-3-O-[3-hydroxymyristoyl] glucosamine N-acyltransferase